MRLIDADALIEVLKKYKFGVVQKEIERAYIKEVILRFVEEQPTAYDVEKVLAQMDKKNSTAIETLGEQKGQVFIRTMNLAKQMVLNGGKE